ncbi:hypothetical protein ACFUN8_00795 [Streptomyces sp. NPDC057307]|uniref:hypothetical protein n=1 Tax=Streptomyces sp. NPDC057307 TaxID=3346096 RepID=UPI003627585B
MKGDRQPKSDVEAATREWSFVMYPEHEPTQEQSDRFDRADALAGGQVGWEQDQQGTRFPCVVRAPQLEAAVAWAVERLGELGLPIARVETTEGGETPLR